MMKNANDFPIKQVEFKPEEVDFSDIGAGKLAYISDYELPTVKISLIIRSGTFYHPPESSLELEATGDLIRLGGTNEYSPDELDLLLEKYSASITSDLGTEFTTFSLSCLKSDLDKLFPIFAEVVLKPRFDLKRINLWKGQSIEGILRRKDDPNAIAGIAFNAVLFGDENQIGGTNTVEDVRKIKRINLVRNHRKILASKDKIFLATGALSKEEVSNLINNNFPKFEGNGETLKYQVNLPAEYEPGIYYIEGDFQQTAIIMGERGIRRLNPDDFKILAFNGIFGSDGFSSRLMQEVRTKQGLAYGIYGGMSQGSITGKNLIIAQTKAESTAESIISSLKILSELQSGNPSKQEIDDIKLSESNSFVFNFVSQEGILSRFVSQLLLGYPKDYDQEYLDKLRKINGGDVQDVANKYWDLSKLVIILVGNAQVRNEIKELKNSPYLKDYQVKELIFDQKVVGEN